MSSEFIFPTPDIIAVSLTHTNVTWCTDNYQLFMSQHVTGDLSFSVTSLYCSHPFFFLLDPGFLFHNERSTEQTKRMGTQSINLTHTNPIFSFPDKKKRLQSTKNDYSYYRLKF